MADLIRRVAAAALGQADRLLYEWFPNGTVKGGYFHIGNLHGDPGESLAIKLADGGFKDYSDPTVKGGDLVALYAKIHGTSQLDAAKAMARSVGIDADAPAGRHAPEAAAAGPAPSARAAAAKEWERLSEPPADAPDWRWILTSRERGDASRYWIYKAANGNPAVIVVRWDYTVDGQPEKDVRPYHCERHVVNGRMRWWAGSIDAPRPVLNLPEILAAPEAPVIVVEGEKAHDAAKRWADTWLPGAIVTTSLNGATNAHKSDWSWAKGRRILIWPDADETQDEYESYLATCNTDKPRNRDVSGSFYRDAVDKLCAAAGARSIDTVDRGEVATLVGLPILPRGFDAADVATDAPVVLDALLVEPIVIEDLFVGDEPEAAAAGEAKASPQRFETEHQYLIDSMVKYIDRKGIVPDALDGWRRASSWALVNDDIAALANDFAFGYRHIDPKMSQSRIIETLEAWTRQQRRARRAALLATITGTAATANGLEALIAWVRAVTGDTRPLDIAVMKHWIWNCKRMALGLRTEHDLMPVAFGPQGSGKTTAVQMLVKTLHELALDMDATYLTDDRKAPVLAHALIGRWEEMQGSQRADLEALKHCITSPTIAYRPMRTNQTVVLPRTCSFIGTSNLPVDVMIQDTTGARRFVELRTPPRCDWDALTAIDPIALWQCVSETEPAPILDHLHLLRSHQVELVHRDPVSLWLESETWSKLYWTRADSPQPYEVDRYDPSQGELFEELCARFGFWCRTTTQSSVGTKTFAMRLRQEGFTWKQERLPNGTRPRVYFVPARFLPNQDPPAGPSPAPVPSPSPSPITPMAAHAESTNPRW